MGAAIPLVIMAAATTYAAVEAKKARKEQKQILDKQSEAADMQVKRQQELDDERKKKEEEALKEGFSKAATFAPRKVVSGAELPGATPRETIGLPISPTVASKTLIGA